MANHSQLRTIQMNLNYLRKVTRRPDFPSGDPTDPTPPADPPADPATDPPVDPVPQAIKVKYNHQELELPYEEAVQHSHQRV